MQATSSQRLNLALGCNTRHLFRFGGMPVNMQLGAYDIVARPDFGTT